MDHLTIEQWVNQLAAIPERDFSEARISVFVSEQAIRPESLAPYAFYASHYTRNLIYRCDLFEVLAICWQSGQQSLPHDHGSQNCWMVAPIGRLRVQNFRVEERDSGTRTCKLIAADSFDMDATHPARVENDAPVHQVSNLREFGGRAASVHLYSRPYESCEIYDGARGVYSVKTLEYWSVYGKQCRTKLARADK
jgi:cysteine dioxygenase